MTAKWGPMGWMMLHSVSACYPDTPLVEDMQKAEQFINDFAFSITCAHCREDFSKMVGIYKQTVPSWKNSKYDFFIMCCRLHNSVNKKIDKPTPKTVFECIQFLKNATMYTSQTEFRNKYIEYLFRDWNYFGRGQSIQIPALAAINRLKKQNDEYWSSRETSYDTLTFPETDVLSFPNEDVASRPVFPRLKLKNVKWYPKQAE